MRGFGFDGTLQAVLVHGDQAVVDEAAMHGRSALEAGLHWVARREELPAAAERHWLVFVTIIPAPGGERYGGAVAAELWIDRAGGRGYKDLALQVNRMAEAMAGQVRLDGMTPAERRALGRALAALAPQAWAAAGELRAQTS